VITDEQVRDLASRHRVAPEVVCTTCGRPSYSAAHHGHPVTRVRTVRDRQVATSAAPRVKVPVRPAIEWITVYEIARELGVSKMTVYRLIHSGELPSHRIGRSFRVKRESFDAYLNGTVTVLVDE
jgi:excisionase family DNA binding protein